MSLVSVVTALLVVGVFSSPVGARGSSRVDASESGLSLDGQAWWPTGFNAYQLATDWSVNFGCGAMVDLDEYFGSLPPRSLTRFDAFQALAINRFTGQMDYGPMDAVFDAAERHDQLLVPVLSPQDGACETGKFKSRDWYVDGWKNYTPEFGRETMSFQDWMNSAALRWRDSPSLAAWELVGEPETSECTDAACNWWTRNCPPDAAQVLREFFDDAGAELRSTDPNTLITAGFTGGGQCGTAGDDYQYVSASPAVDVVQYHDYGADGVPLPGDQWNGLARRIVQAADVGKPLLVAEIGENAGSCEDLDDRADHIDTKLSGQKAAGTAGALLWAFVPDPRLAECTMDIGYEDPLYAVIGDQAD
ncbi:cellulase family glycosylhydrolase [Rhodococcus sp. IEGM 1379]|nr:cellulase family glycosylhydrolase [Rhodococcus sp. IEGM 1379]